MISPFSSRVGTLKFGKVKSLLVACPLKSRGARTWEASTCHECKGRDGKAAESPLEKTGVSGIELAGQVSAMVPCLPSLEADRSNPAGKPDPHTDAVSAHSQHIIGGKQRITHLSIVDTIPSGPSRSTIHKPRGVRSKLQWNAETLGSARRNLHPLAEPIKDITRFIGQHAEREGPFRNSRETSGRLEHRTTEPPAVRRGSRPRFLVPRTRIAPCQSL